MLLSGWNIPLQESIENTNNKPYWEVALAHTNKVSRYIVLERPVYLNKIKNGSKFLYKHLKFVISKTNPVANSAWSISYNEDLNDGIRPIMDNFIDSIITEIIEILPCLKYNVNIVFNFNKLDTLDLSNLFKYTDKKNINLTILGLTECNSINLGKCNLLNTCMHWMFNSDTIKRLGYIDCSEAYNDYTKVITGGFNEPYSVFTLRKGLKGTIIFCNEATPNFNKSICNINNLVYLGVVSNSNKYVDSQKLLAKYLLLNKKSKVDSNFIVIVR